MTTINLLPWREKARKRAKQVFIAACLSVIVAALVINGIWYSVLQGKINQQMQRNAFLQSEVTLAEQSNADKKTFEKEKAATLSQVSTLQELHNQRFRIIELLQSLPNLLPSHVLIDAIHINATIIELTGESKTDSQVSDFVKRLKEEPHWSNVQLQELSEGTTPSQTNTFRITLSLD